MTLSSSKRSERLIQADIRNMSIECERMNGINLSQGICDMSPPKQLIDGINKALECGVHTYTRYDGLAEIRRALCKKAKNYNKVIADPEKNIIVSCGSTGALYCAALALLNPGDEVIVFQPYYGYHINTLDVVGAKPVFAKLNPPKWSIDYGELERLTTEKTKAIIINTPANPCGKVFTSDELRRLGDYAIRNDIFIFTDEIYEYIVFDGLKHTSPASIESITDRTITVSGHSKTFSITGWRIGYCLCDERWAQTIGFLNDLVYVCAPAPLQYATAYAIEHMPDSYYSDLKETYQIKRDRICEALIECGFELYKPQGAYYVLADAEHISGKTSKEKAMTLLMKTGIACVPGSAFYNDSEGEKMLRFCFAKEDNELDKACNMLRRVD
jgi:aminotransferase